ncbi:metal-dependent hydrolase family protein [Pseudonocardia acaciae]|uniref:metal-dependent hydrolase family protein n=1 Tax=Pseudonocardia acaciae TaxID=551276 RepID=UPI0006874F0E|nr:amidohydrolase family protein [Pseudonocardia acaciae]
MVTVFRAPRLLTHADAPLVDDGAVVVDGERIVAAGAWSEIEVPAPAQVRELDDVTLLPGLVDAHVHLAMDAEPTSTGTDLSRPDAELALVMAQSARRLLDAGVTTARDLGCPGTLSVAVRDAIAARRIPGPRMLVANAPITVTGGHAWAMGGEADTAEDVVRQVRLRAKEGADLVKIMTTGGFMTAGSRPWHARYTVEHLSAGVDEAHRLGMRVTTHALGVEGIARAVAAGVDSIEHCAWLTETGSRFDPAVAARMVAAGIAVCPTMNTACLPEPYFCPWDSRAAVLDNLRAMHAAGLEIIAGTDAGIGMVPFQRYADGLDILGEAGMSPRQVLAAATAKAARACGLASVTGTLAPGMAADVLAVPGDPTEDLSVLHRPLFVLARGDEHACAPAGEPTGDAATAERIRATLTAGAGRA